MAILKNSIIVAFWTAASRGLGFARDLLIANKLGAGVASDAFFIALMLPNLFRRLFGEGAFNVAFVPILARHKGVSEAKALEYASAAFSWLLPCVLLVTLIGVIAMPLLVTITASGWVSDPAKFDLAVSLGRICFPYLGLITVAAFLGAMCNTFGKFAAYAMVPALLNLSILLCLFALPGTMGMEPVYAAAWSIPLGGLAQAAYMLWAARKLGLVLKLQWLPKHADLKTLLYRLGPAAIGVGVLQLSILIDNHVASYLPEGAISYLQYANRFYQLPLALIGIAVATVLLPQLAVLLGAGNRKEATQTFTSALSACLALAVGSGVGLLILAPELTVVTLKHGEFTVWAANATAWAMMGFVVGLPGYILTKVTAPAFFASEDPISPVKASAVALLVNLLLNIIMVILARVYGLEHIAHVGIALATAAGGYVNAALQWHWLNARGVLDVDRKALGRDVVKMLTMGIVLLVALVGYKMALPFNLEWALPLEIMWLAGAVALGATVFGAGVEATGLMKIRDVMKALKERPKVKLKTGGGDADL